MTPLALQAGIHIQVLYIMVLFIASGGGRGNFSLSIGGLAKNN